MTERTITSNERTLAVLAHLSVLLGVLTNGVGGVVAAIVIWLTQRDKSAYVTFHALQSVAYQVLTMAASILVWCCWLVFYLASFIPMIPQMEQNPDAAPPPLFWIGIGSMIIPLAAMGLVVLYGLWGALRTYQGKDFRYVIVGRWVERYLAEGS